MISREHILSEVARAAAANGGKPLGRLRFFTVTGIKESDWRGTYWARWNDVLRDAGFGPNVLVEPTDDNVLLDHLARLARELGRFPVNSEMRLKKRTDPSFPNDKTYDRFGSKSDLVRRMREFAATNPTFSDLLPLIDAELTVSAPKKVASEPSDAIVLGTVYLLKSGRFYKIGRSNSASRREREISLQLPEKAAMVHMISTDDPTGIEAYWHKRFADRRKNGEWFDLTAADISAFRRRKFM